MHPKQPNWAARLRALAQAGLHQAQDVYDRERFTALAALAAEIAGHAAGAPLPRLYQGTAARTPYSGVRGAIFNAAGEVLLVREQADGLWALPGGFCEVGDTPAQAIEREILEETGLRARAVRLVAVYDRRRHDHSPNPVHSAFYMFFFLCEALSDAPGIAHGETLDVGYFPLTSLPPLSRDRLTLDQLQRCHAHWLDRRLPAEFD